MQPSTSAAPYSPIHELCPVPLQKPLKPLSYTKQQTSSHPIVEPDDEQDNTPNTTIQPASTLHLSHQQQDTLQHLMPGTMSND